MKLKLKFEKWCISDMSNSYKLYHIIKAKSSLNNYLKNINLITSSLQLNNYNIENVENVHSLKYDTIQ